MPAGSNIKSFSLVVFFLVFCSLLLETNPTFLGGKSASLLAEKGRMQSRKCFKNASKWKWNCVTAPKLFELHRNWRQMRIYLVHKTADLKKYSWNILRIFEKLKNLYFGGNKAELCELAQFFLKKPLCSVSDTKLAEFQKVSRSTFKKSRSPRKKQKSRKGSWFVPYLWKFSPKFSR